MEGMHKASKFEPQDFISSMPDDVLANIMDRLPLQDAVRTCILARNWRFKWTMLSQLVFDQDFYEYIWDRDCRDDLERIISMFLLHLKGVITKFYLYLNEESCFSERDISHWILFLSRNGVKDLTLCTWNGSPLKLPTPLFSCLGLKYLKLDNCSFDSPAAFHVFPNLLSLEFCHGEFESGGFGEFLTRCPVLESLKISDSVGRLKLAEIARLVNLKVLSLFLCNLDNTSSCSIFGLIGFLPKLQELDLDFSDCKLTEGVAEKRFSTTFPCLKTLKLSDIDSGNGINLSYAFQMIRSFPNLQTLQITSSYLNAAPTTGNYSLEIDCNTMGLLLQLRSVVFTNFKALKKEACLIKYLLKSSPSLKKIVIRPYSRKEAIKQLMFAMKLLKLQRSYPVVGIDYRF